MPRSKGVTFAAEPQLEPEEEIVEATQTQTNRKQQHQQQQQQPKCPSCQSTHIELHEASGASICTDCGCVVEENAIVSSVEFVEGAGGSSSMVGQFVSATSSKAYSASVRGGGRYGFSKDSRETTLNNGRRKIQELASKLRLGSHFVDSAHRLFSVAVEKNFVQGRRTSHVVAACLYISCRQEKSQHMLIDFADALAVNVYTLGTCFLKFRRLLGLRLEIIDPALYVYRFAAHLDLDDQANQVSMTALRLVARMKRDWIVAGRRPAGICAAALLIASRAHGFDKQCADVTRILRVCGMTVTKRVREFEKTPTARLTMEQFSTIDFDQEADPPVYTRNKIMEARARAIQDKDTALLTSGALDDPNLKRKDQWRKQDGKKSERQTRMDQAYNQIEQTLAMENEDGTAAQKAIPHQEEAVEVTAEAIAQQATNPNASAAEVPDFTSKDSSIVLHKGSDATISSEQWKKAFPKVRGRDLRLPNSATKEEQKPSVVPTESLINMSEWMADLPAEVDEELANMFLDEEEERQKEVIFNKLNKDYIKQQERKENERLTAEAATKDQDEDLMAQAAGQARYRESRGKKRNKESMEGSTTEEQLRAVVESRKVSRKINYDALSSIFDDDGSFSTDAVPDDPGDEDMF